MSKHEPNALSISEIPGDNEHHFSDEDKVFAGSTVPVKYRGTRNDKDDMAVMGRKQVLRRNFKLPTMLGFASTVVRLIWGCQMLSAIAHSVNSLWRGRSCQ